MPTLTDHAPTVEGYGPLTLLEECSDAEVLVYDSTDLKDNLPVRFYRDRRPQNAQESFSDELQVLSNLEHPHLVKLRAVEILEEEGHVFPCACYPRLEGKRLCDDPDYQSPQPPRRVVQLLLPALKALQLLHQRGAHHGHLSPETIHLAPTSDPVSPKKAMLTEAGLGYVLSTSKAKVCRVVAEHMAPEQHLSESPEITDQAEIYSLGTILYRMLTGMPPHWGATAMETAQLAKDRRPIPPRHYRPLIPKTLSDICLRCLEPSPKKRYPTVSALIDDLEGFLQEKEAPKATAKLRISRKTIRRVTRSATLMVLLLLLFSLGARTMLGQLLSKKKNDPISEVPTIPDVEAHLASLETAVQLAHDKLTQGAKKQEQQAVFQQADQLASHPGLRHQLDPAQKLLHANQLARLCWLSMKLSQTDRASVHYQRGVELIKKLEKLNAPTERSQRAEALHYLGRVALLNKQVENSQQHLEQSAKLYQTLIADDPEHHNALARLSVDLSRAWSAKGRQNTALKHRRSELNHLLALIQHDSKRDEVQMRFLNRAVKLAQLQQLHRQSKDLATTLQQARAQGQKLIKHRTHSEQALRLMAILERMSAESAIRSGDWTLVQRSITAGNQNLTELEHRYGKHSDYQLARATLLAVSCRLHLHQKEEGKATTAAKKALAIWNQLLQTLKGEPRDRCLWAMARFRCDRAKSLMSAGKNQEVVKEASSAVKLLTDLSKRPSLETDVQSLLALAQNLESSARRELNPKAIQSSKVEPSRGLDRQELARLVRQASAGNWQNARQGAAALANRLENLEPALLYNVACLHSLLARAIQNDQSLTAPKRKALVAEHQKQALTILHQLKAQIRQNVRLLQALKNDLARDFLPLKDHPRMKELMRDLKII